MVVGEQKGASTEENIRRNFGMPHPEGYRKAIRLYKLAEKFHLPLITLVDTPGAYPGPEAEERGQAEAIAKAIFTMTRLRTPIVVVILGEGGSGGALALAIGDVVLMMENAIYSVISPEGSASILGRSPAGPSARRRPRVFGTRSADLGVVDASSRPAGGGTPADHAATARRSDRVVATAREVRARPVSELLSPGTSASAVRHAVRPGRVDSAAATGAVVAQTAPDGWPRVSDDHVLGLLDDLMKRLSDSTASTIEVEADGFAVTVSRRGGVVRTPQGGEALTTVAPGGSVRRVDANGPDPSSSAGGRHLHGAAWSPATRSHGRGARRHPTLGVSSVKAPADVEIRRSRDDRRSVANVMRSSYRAAGWWRTATVREYASAVPVTAMPLDHDDTGSA